MSTPTSIRSTANGRADARRNRALVLAAAQRALAEGGLAVSLAEVARPAGGGAGPRVPALPPQNAPRAGGIEQSNERRTG
ncbi:hypothetical protein ACFXO7_08310, partial [Nocardia tengchongensis]